MLAVTDPPPEEFPLLYYYRGIRFFGEITIDYYYKVVNGIYGYCAPLTIEEG
jgi:hypothetical protein